MSTDYDNYAQFLGTYIRDSSIHQDHQDRFPYAYVFSQEEVNGKLVFKVSMCNNFHGLPSAPYEEGNTVELNGKSGAFVFGDAQNSCSEFFYENEHNKITIITHGMGMKLGFPMQEYNGVHILRHHNGKHTYGVGYHLYESGKLEQQYVKVRGLL